MSDAQLPRVSICLLTYKRAQLLPRTLDSLLTQSHRDFELIINDDNSPDTTEEVCREYARRDPRIRYFKNSENLRYAGNQNAAICRAATDYVGIVHDGDVYRADMVEKWALALTRHPTAALVFNAVEVLDFDGKVVSTHRHPYGSHIPGRELLDEMLESEGSPIFGIVMVRRSRVLEAGPFDIRLPVLADVDMWLRLLLKHDAAYIAEPLYAVSPRESDHQNTYTNWRILAERELIYGLNYRRRLASSCGTGATPPARRTLNRALWKTRAEQLFACLRHAEPRAFLQLVQYLRSKPFPLAVANEAESAGSWDTYERMAATPSHREPALPHNGMARRSTPEHMGPRGAREMPGE